MDASHRHQAEWKEPGTNAAHSVWFCSHKAHEEAKLSRGDRTLTVAMPVGMGTEGPRGASEMLVGVSLFIWVLVTQVCLPGQDSSLSCTLTYDLCIFYWHSLLQ